MRKTSIIILTWNQIDYTKLCINSIRLYTKPDYEIIVVDNASTDGTVEWLKEQSDITAIFNDINKGFPAGCNQGILKSTGDVIVLLNNDIFVTPRWLDNLLSCLNSSDKIGAVGPCSNSAGANQILYVNYENLDEMISFATNYNKSNEKLWRERTRLAGFCFAVKKTVINEVGLFDERFFPGNYEDDDYCFRIRQSGYKLMFCADTFIHHYGNVSFKTNPLYEGTASDAFHVNGRRFEEKWGFNTSYHSSIRYDAINLIDQSESRKNLYVLEVGCGCGATILEIKYLFPGAKVFGIEANQSAAEMARSFADIKTGDVENMNIDYPNDYFDYILLSDILEHMINPWEFLVKIKKYLKPAGYIITGIPNVMHFSVILELFKGNWDYTDKGILDKDHLRFFTLKSIRDMFEKSGYAINQINAQTSSDDGMQNFLEYLYKAIPPEMRNELMALMYTVKAQRYTS